MNDARTSALTFLMIEQEFLAREHGPHQILECLAPRGTAGAVTRVVGATNALLKRPREHLHFPVGRIAAQRYEVDALDRRPRVRALVEQLLNEAGRRTQLAVDRVAVD